MCNFSGFQCLQWNSEAVLMNGALFSEQTAWDHNRCRNPDGDRAPWCMVSPTRFDLCDIPVCQQGQGKHGFLGKY